MYVEGGENRTDSNTPTSRKNVEQSAGTIKMEHKDTTWRPHQTRVSKAWHTSCVWLLALTISKNEKKIAMYLESLESYLS